ncbi:MAG: hypothetical protein KDB04_02620 [Acidimicrobiales bacterium]|nr:hypothetical protein [Acidimicrobiales bacterium]HRW39533.1 hypothetical protein [Aquihabitans sp.]
MGGTGGLTRRRVLGGAAAVVAASMVGCAPPKRVYVIGDSLTMGAVAQGLGEATNDGATTWRVDAAAGLGTNQATALVDGYDLGGYELVIVALGTNDYLDSAGMYGVRIDRMMTALRGHPRVRWVNVDAGTSKLQPAAAGVDAALAAAPARHNNLRILDWDAHFRALPDASSMRSGDGVHYTAAGYRVRRDFLRAVAS